MAIPRFAGERCATTHLALERLRSSYVNPAEQDFAAVLADNLSNAGIVLGGGQPVADPDLSALHLELRREAEQIGTAQTDASLDTLIAALSWLSGYGSALGAPFLAGTVIITGSRIGARVRPSTRTLLGVRWPTRWH